MNLGDVKTRVKRQFGDESAVQITDEDITRWVNDAVQYIVMNNDGLLQKIDTADIFAGVQDYSLPQDLLTLRAVHIKISPDSLSHVHIQSYDLQKFDTYVDGWDGTYYGTGIPYVYTIYADQLKLFPIPDLDSAGGLKFYYTRRPAILDSSTDDGEEIDLPLSYHNGVVHYCLQQAYEMDENLESYNRKALDVQEHMRMNRDKQKDPQQEYYKTITPLYDDAW